MKPIGELKEVTLNSGFIHILTMVSGDLNHSSDRACSGEFRTQKKGIGRFNESGFRQRSDNVACPKRSDSGKRRELGKASEKKKKRGETVHPLVFPAFFLLAVLRAAALFFTPFLHLNAWSRLLTAVHGPQTVYSGVIDIALDY